MELQLIKNKIHEIRGQRVMIDFDLAEMYGVDTRSLKQAVKRNESRFPPDFMFELSKEEWDNLISQNVISNRGGNRFLPYAFTKQGVAMLSSVLRSERAIEINIQIIRAFILIRQNTLLFAEINHPSTSSGTDIQSTNSLRPTTHRLRSGYHFAQGSAFLIYYCPSTSLRDR
ncbi:MAG: ORF6N domain-containing protein [Bacteroidia bacterium]|nr:ORF6N domain-containing protein [Bacteroidia bacterium]